MIEVNNIKKYFGKFYVLKGINLNLEAGNVVAITGPNGSGKTTFLKSILGLIIPDEGEILVHGLSVRKNFEYRQHIGYMPQIARYPENLKVKELIHMIRDIRGKHADLDEELTGVFNLPELYEKALGTLSGGQKQKVGAVLAFMFNPGIIILDEPTAGLDPVSTELIKAKIRKEKLKGKLIIITTHIMSEVDDLADRLLYLNDGKIDIDKTIDEIKEETHETKLGKALAKIMTAGEATIKFIQPELRKYAL